MPPYYCSPNLLILLWNFLANHVLTFHAPALRLADSVTKIVSGRENLVDDSDCAVPRGFGSVKPGLGDAADANATVANGLS